ncbi:MAG: DUF433 domain-containing protein [Spirulinaceae cyanobacterium]
MVSAQVNHGTAIARTERGLVISGTRITLYDILDYTIAQYPAQFIQGWLNLTPEQMAVALTYIQEHETAVEAEYQSVVHDCEELRADYQKRNRELIARLARRPPKPGMEAAWQKLQAQKAKHQAQGESCA